MNSPRIVFLGTGDIAMPVFRWLLRSAVPPVALITQPDRLAGRRKQLRAPAVKTIALEHGIEVMQPEKVRDTGFLDTLEHLEPDLLIVMAYGQILPTRLIEMASVACVNLHASLLPKYRGAACIQAAIDAGDSETGMTLMHVVKELDAGDVILSKSTPISADDTGGSVHDRLAELAVEVIEEGLPSLIAGSAARVAQSELGDHSHVSKLDRDDGRVDWSWSAERIERRVRAYDPWPGCWCLSECEEVPKRLKLFPQASVVEQSLPVGEVREEDGKILVGCGAGSLALGEVQAEGARRMAALDWWRGLRVSGSGRLG